MGGVVAGEGQANPHRGTPRFPGVGGHHQIRIGIARCNPGTSRGRKGGKSIVRGLAEKRVRRLRCHCQRPGVVVVVPDPIRATRAVVPQDEMGLRLNVSACRTTGLCRKGRMEAFSGCDENPGMVIHGMMGEEMAVMRPSPIAEGTPRN